MHRPARSAVVPLIAFDRGEGTFYRQIYEGYRKAILDGRLRSGQRLPSTRAIARELGISRLPVLTAFEQLLHEGYVESRHGSGTFVASSILGAADGTVARTARRRLPAATRAPSISKARRDVASPCAQQLLGPFRVSLPALDHFPRKTWARLVARHARHMPLELMAYGNPAGHLPLREAIADYLRTSRAVACDARQILIVSGSQMALQLCARVLLRSGDVFCVEEPGYPGAKDALRATGASMCAVPVDGDGLVVRAMRVGSSAARLAYVTPSHQYPLGMSMNVARRLALLEWARRCQAWIVEDDYDSEYRFASRPLGSLQGMDSASRVVYIGTFSKVLFPALRVGYLVVPSQLVDGFIAQRSVLDLFSPPLYQLALNEFLREGHFARHLRRTRAVYLQRRDALVEAIRRRLGETLSVVNADAGMHLTAWLPPDVDDREVVKCAVERRISVSALSTCYSGSAARSGLILGFGGTDEARLVRAVAVLAQAIEESRHGRKRSVIRSSVAASR